MVDEVDPEDTFEFVSVSNTQDLNDLVEELVTGLDDDGQPSLSTRGPRPATTVSNSNSQGHRGGLADPLVQATQMFPYYDYGELEPVSNNELVDRFPPIFVRDLEGQNNSQFSQSSQGSDMSHASLNEDSRSLRNSSFDSTSGVGLYSPAGSHPNSQSASLPIQYPSSQETALEGASLRERLQEIAAVVPDASRQRVLQQFGFGQQQQQ